MPRPTGATDRARRAGGWLALAALAVLAACVSPQQLTAANDVHAFLISIRDADRATFDAHVDRSALKAQLAGRLTAEAARHGDTAAALAAVLGPTIVDIGVDNLVRPEVFRAVAEQLGYSPDKPIPGVVGIAQALKPIDGTHVCVITKRDGPCLFTFADEGGVWRLTAFDGDLGQLVRQRRR